MTTAGTRDLAAGTAGRRHAVALHEAWQALSDTGRRALVVRSSSTVEDGGSQSMAGLFTSVLDVQGWEAFLAAVDEVVGSGGEAPIAVLVQPFLQPTWGGVLFGADPVTGRTDRLVVAAVPGGPDRLVSGQVDGVQLTLTARGRLDEAGDDVPAELRARRTRRKLVGLARRTAQTFGGPQDIEWAIDASGTIVLLQSRPITAVGDEARATGPVFGPGPVAETFGLPLRPLEVDLWVDPLRDGVREALRITGARSPRQLRRSPAVVVVGGRVAADLDLLGLLPRRRSLWSRINPVPPARRLKAAWRVGPAARRPAGAGRRPARTGRRRPRLAAAAHDAHRLPSSFGCCGRSRQTLRALHGHEVLAGMLLDDGGDAIHRGLGGPACPRPGRRSSGRRRRARRRPPRAAQSRATAHRWPGQPPPAARLAAGRTPRRPAARRRCGRPCDCGSAGSRSSRPGPRSCSVNGSSAAAC